LALLTPADVHFHRAQAVIQKRQVVLQAAYRKTPERFVKGLPVPPQLPYAVWINPPTPVSVSGAMEATLEIDSPEMKTRTAAGRAPFPFG
jgi:hypothetical protein